MAEKATTQPYPIEQLQKKHTTPPSVFSGVMVQQGWCKGKSVTMAEYLAAVQKFQKGTVR